MPERPVPTVLIDGPSAGQLVYTDPDALAWYVAPQLDWTQPLNLSTWVIPEPILYRLRRCTACVAHEYRTDLVPFSLRIGWSDAGEPDEGALRRYGRAVLLQHPELLPGGTMLWPADPADDEPIRVLDTGAGPSPYCRDEFQLKAATRLLRGVCPCGWRTELVEQRRLGELRALTAAHARAAMAEFMAAIERGRTVLAALAGSNASLGLGETIAAANRRADEQIASWRDRTDGLYWGERLAASDADWPAQGSTCAHVCGGGRDHACDASATQQLEYDLPSGGTRTMPICQPCLDAETAAKETADA